VSAVTQWPQKFHFSIALPIFSKIGIGGVQDGELKATAPQSNATFNQNDKTPQ
jgi:hypothetical protein